MTYLTKAISKAKYTSSRYRYVLLFVSVFGSSLVLFSLNKYTEIAFLSHALTGSWHSHGDLDILASTDDSFTIKTKGCTITRLLPFDKTIERFIKRPASRPCLSTNESLLENNDTHIWINSEKLQYYEVPMESDFACCYRSFFRPNVINSTEGADVDDRVQYESCINFTNIIKATNEFVRVTCGYDNKIFYEQFFLFAIEKPPLTRRENGTVTSINASEYYNVLIVGIDAISRLNFHRTMPKTLSYLKSKGAIEFLGYNKVGDNTFPNLTPMLMGMKDKDLKHICWPNNKDNFDKCPFVWNWFKDAGYYTAFGEDSASLKTFGFNGTPTDYYIHTFMYEAEVHAGNNRDFNSYVCMGNKHFYKVLLDYVESLTSTLKMHKLFGFFWEVTFSHDFLNYPMLMDNSYEQFLKKLDDTNYLNNTILILLSDHGIRWGDIRYTKQGRLEERLPFVYIMLPPSFKGIYTLAYDNLKLNSKRLTTPFDIYSTLLDLVSLDSITNAEIKRRMRIHYGDARSFSLFMPVPENRTCQSAGIDDHWCTCHSSNRRLSTNNREAREAAHYLVSHLNSMVSDYVQCAKLKLEDILEVTEMVAGTPGENEVGWREFIVVVKTEPGGGVFEATVRLDDRSWELTGTPSRLNLYGTQSRCVHHYQIKLYCFCR